VKKLEKKRELGKFKGTEKRSVGRGNYRRFQKIKVHLGRERGKKKKTGIKSWGKVVKEGVGGWSTKFL